MRLSKLLFIILFFLISKTALVQNRIDSDFIFNEFTVSLNHTSVENQNTANRLGLGIGMYKSWRDSYLFGFVSGISYNQTSQFKNYITMGQMYNYSKATFILHSFSIPFLMRLNFGSRTKFFIESGMFAEITAQGTCKATAIFYSFSGPTEVRAIKDKGIFGNNFGAIANVGFLFPVGNYEILSKFGYQFGFNSFGFGHESLRNVFLSASLGFKLY